MLPWQLTVWVKVEVNVLPVFTKIKIRNKLNRKSTNKINKWQKFIWSDQYSKYSNKRLRHFKL